MKQKPNERIRKWVEEAVVGLNLCPFAKPYTLNDSIKYIESEGTSLEPLVEEVFFHIEKMTKSNIKDNSNTLLIYESQFTEFDDFWDFVNICIDTLENSTFSETFQLAYFHPDFVFEDSQGNKELADKKDFTAKSPYPVIHILRSELVEAVRLTHENIDDIPDDNIKKVSTLDIETLRKIFTQR
jgi:hypothetical protein